MFTTGQHVIYNDLQGIVQHVFDEYITVCINKYDSEYVRGETCVCLCVYPEQQDKVIILGDK